MESLLLHVNNPSKKLKRDKKVTDIVDVCNFIADNIGHFIANTYGLFSGGIILFSGANYLVAVTI